MRKLLLALVMMLCVGSAWTAGTSAPAPTASIKGKVLEVLDAESFVYLRLQTKDGETWAVVAKTPVKKGTEITIDNVTTMTNFESKKLNRKFDQIVFGSIATSSASAAAGGDMAAMHAGIAKAADVGDVKVAKASGPNARTVAEIVSRKADFKDKAVEVRGKVVKFTGGVLGKNWIHLRDGSGSASDGSNDVLVTTKDEAKIGGCRSGARCRAPRSGLWVRLLLPGPDRRSLRKEVIPVVITSTLLPPFWLIRAAVAAVWLYEGLWCKLLRGQPHEFEVVEAVPYFGPRVGALFLRALGVVEVAIAVWTLSAISPVVCAVAQTLLLVTLNANGLLWARHIIHDPAGMVVKNFAFLVLVWVCAGLPGYA